jgi:hypothetical protein
MQIESNGMPMAMSRKLFEFLSRRSRNNRVLEGLLVILCFFAASTDSIACTCAGIQSIGEALRSADAVVVGRVRGHVGPNLELDVPDIGAINVEVLETVTGSVRGDIRIEKTLWCYRSFDEDDFEVGTSYVFPLQRSVSKRPSSAGDTEAYGKEIYRLPTCSHNALLMRGERLYTSEDGARQLQYFMSLGVMKMLLPTGILSVWDELPYVLLTILLLYVAFIVLRRRRKRPAEVAS